MDRKNITEIVKDFEKGLNDPKKRYTSYDYCYNYFRQTENLTDDIEKSCLVLGFYLASWGMLRGSSFLLEKSAKYLEPTIKYISELDKSIWNIDVDQYNEDNITEILKVYNGVKENLVEKYNTKSGSEEYRTHLTLVSKVLLGVFGFVTAFDQYFCYTFREIYRERENCAFTSFNRKSLECIKDFYDKNKSEIDKLSKGIKTFNFNTGKYTELNYTKAKIIDMYGFNYGLMKDRKKT